MPTLQKGLIFIQLQTEKRDGCKEDKESIMETFQNHFQSEVILWENYTGMQIEAEFEKMLRDSGWLGKFESCEFVAVFSLSHGNIEGQIQLADDIYEVQSLLLNPLFKFRQLNGKLKWLISQSCRGNSTSVGDYEFDNGGDVETDGETYDHYHYISNCTAESTRSNQLLQENGNNGKIFIQTICAELKKNSYSLTLDEMLDNVKDAVVDSLKKDIVTLVDKKLIEMSTALRAIFTDDNNKKKNNLPSDDLWQRVRECVYECVKKLMEMSTALRAIFTDDNNKKKNNLPSDDLWQRVRECVYKCVYECVYECVNEHVKYSENATLNESVENEVELYLSDNSKLEEILNNISEAVRPYLMDIYVRFAGISTPTYKKSCADEHKFWKE